MSEGSRESIDDAEDSATRVVGERDDELPSARSGSASAPYSGDPTGNFASEVLPLVLRTRLGAGSQTRLGRYLLHHVLGEGGMGVVFSAHDEELDRKVAIKVLSARADGGSAGRARIRREAQALAKLSHPNIVQIYEVGEESGQIYLVMELIDGDNLRAWRKAAPRSWREVLGRWIEAGRGLAAAHAAGLIHRDFKPDNAIVGRDGRVRVVDFGLARSGGEVEPTKGTSAAASESYDDATLTAAGSLVGTPAYMPPEQHLRQAVDHRGDIFAFCVSLYEALYGERPFSGRGQALARAIIKGEVPEAPRGAKVPLWLRRVVLRGLEPDPRERWQEMDALLAALADDPAIRRRRLAGLGALAVGAALVGNLLRPVADSAEDPCAGVDAGIDPVWNEARAAAVGEALVASGLPHAADAWSRARARIDEHVAQWRAASVAACEDTHVRNQQSAELLDRRLACLRGHRREIAALVDSLAEGGAAAVDHAIDASDALSPIRECDADALVHDRVAPPTDPAILAEVEAIRDELARIKAVADAGRPREVVDAADPALARATATEYIPVIAEAHLRRGLIREIIGDERGAEGEFVAAWHDALASDHDEVAIRAASYLPRMLADEVERHPEALVWQGNATAVARRRGLQPTDELFRLRNLGALDEKAGRYREAAERYAEALAIAVARHGADSPEAGRGHEALALALRLTGDYQAAREHGELALANARRALGEEHPKLAPILQSLAMTLGDLGDEGGAEAATREALRLTERAYGPDNPRLAFMLNDLAVMTCDHGRYEEAEALYRRAIDLRVAAHGREHQLVTTVLYNLGTCLLRQDRREEARALLEEALETREKGLGADHPKVAFPLLGLADLARDEGRFDDAERLYRRALEIREASLGADHPKVAFPLGGLAEVAVERGRLGEAIPLAERALALRTQASSEASELADVRFILAQALGDDRSQRARARGLAEEARVGFAAHAAANGEELAKVEAWLKGHPEIAR